MKAPRRLLDDPGLSPELRNDLERSAALSPDYDVAAGFASFQALIGVAPAASAGAGAGVAQGATSTGVTSTGVVSASTAPPALAAELGLAAITGSGAVKAAIVGAAMVGATVAGWPSGTQQSQPAMAPIRPQVPAAPAQPQRPPEPSQPAPSEASTDAAREVAKTPIPPSPVETDRSRTRRLDATLRREIAQLGRIKSLVTSDPARAYALAQRGRAQFSRGMLREERDALAAISLWNLGEREQAQREARAFVERYPRSPLRTQVEGLLNEPGGLSDAF